MIELVPYSNSWPKEFEAEKKRLLASIDDVSIEHVGSTAVPGLAAKPVIDIMIGVKDLRSAPIKEIVALGYNYIKEYEKEIPERRYFQREIGGKRTHQIHLVVIDSPWWKRHLFFRDYLRKHPDVMKEYESLKFKLAEQHTDSNVYAAAKTDFIRAIECKMHIERQE